MAKALYRKYRPKTLAEVVGQEQVTDILQQSIRQGRISHAYLFVGPRGTGKTSVARIFAHQINKFPYELEDEYIDIIEIDGASNRGIDDIRELREKATIAPSEGKFKVYIIDEVHMLTAQAFNALLKTLEEPPQHVVFLMATTDVQKVPKTILSRTQNYTFKLAEPEVMQKFLRDVSDKEGIKITDDALEVVRRQGGGSFRDSLSLLDQVSTLSEAEITRDLVVAAMGLPDDEKVRELLDVYLTGDLTAIADKLREALSDGAKPELLSEGMIRVILTEPRAEWLGLLARLPEVVAPFPEAKLLVALTQGLQAQPKVSSRGGGAGGGRGGDSVNTSTVNETRNDRVEMAEKSKADDSRDSENKSDEEITNDGLKPMSDPPNWDDFIANVNELSDVVAQQLNKTEHAIDARGIQIYPQKKYLFNVLNKYGNVEILRQASGGKKVVVHAVGEHPSGTGESAKNDQHKATLSDIMGGKVVEDGGENPF